MPRKFRLSANKKHMLTALVQSLNEGAGLVDTFVQSTGSITNYCSWIAGQSDTGNPNLDTILNTCKTHASQWYNTIYPEFLNMPATISAQGQQIDGDLTTLMSLAQQLQANDTPQIRQSITQYAADVSQRLQGLQTQTSGLSSALQIFGGNVAGDVASGYNAGLNIIGQNMNNLQSQLSQFYGQLHSLQNATCPNSGDISACQQQISTTQNEISQYQQYDGVFTNGQRQASDAATASSYLAGFWTSFSQDISNVNNSLQNIQSQPAIILKLDLQETQQNWDNTKAQLQQMSQQVAAA